MQEITGWVFIVLGIVCGAAHVARHRGVLSFEPFSKLPAMERSLGPRPALLLHVAQYVLAPVAIGTFMVTLARRRAARGDVEPTFVAEVVGDAAGRDGAVRALLVLAVLFAIVHITHGVRSSRRNRENPARVVEPVVTDRVLVWTRYALSSGIIVLGLYIALWRPNAQVATIAQACAERDDSAQFGESSDLVAGPWTADHFAFFDEEGHAQRFANEVDARGFEVLDVRFLEVEVPEPARFWRVVFRRLEQPDLATFQAATRELCVLAVHQRGHYDGWDVAASSAE